jgi:hypothetical protein
MRAVIEFPIPTIVTNVKAFLGLTKYYRNYVKGYSHIATTLLELTKKDITFVWMPHCQHAFNMLKDALIKVHILIRQDFTKPFVLHVDCSIRGVGAILSQKEGRIERVVANSNKGMSLVQWKFHPMKGECYALI